MNKTMKEFIVLVAFLGMMPLLLPAQQSQNRQQSDPEIEALKKRVSELEEQLQTVENVEKLDLQAKLTDANAKLANAKFGKFERELRDFNNKWLREWSNWFLVVVGFFVVVSGVVGGIFWFWLRSTANKLIADTVEKDLDGFKKAVAEQKLIKNQLEILEKQYAVSILAGVIDHDLQDVQRHPDQIKVLREETLLQVLADNETPYPILTYKAAEVLAARKSPRVVSPLLIRLNSEADSAPDPHRYYTVPQLARPPEWPDAVKFLTYMDTPEAEDEAYQGLKRFLNHLLTGDPNGKDWFLEKTVSSLVQIAVQLNMEDSVPILKKALHDLENSEHAILNELVEYFHRFNEPASIRKILSNYLDDEPSNMTLPQRELADKCRELLQEY